MRPLRFMPALFALALVLVACGGDDGPPEEAAADEPSSTTERTSTSMTSTTEPVLRYPSGDEVVAGYPLIVPVDTIDRRVASWFEGQLVDGQVVALAPGVYRPYNPTVPDLVDYIDGPSDGDCAVRERFFAGTGGACWDGVQAGTAEPAP